MASSIAAQKLEDQLTCPICLYQYNDPRTLQCLHSFCIKCLERLPLHGKHSLSCPTCRTVVVIPEQGVATLPKAFHLNNLIEVQNLLKRTSGDKKAVCDNCTKQGAELYCQECDKFICHSCNDVHKKWSSLSAHQVVSISEVSSKASQMVSVKPVPVMNCPSHNKPLDLYCVTCEQPICYHCTIKDHKRHTHDLISDAYDEGKTEIQKRVGSLVSRIKEKNEKKKDLQQSKNKAQKEGNKLKLSINEVCDHFVKKIESVRTLGLRSVDSGVLAFNKVEDQQIKEVDEELKALAGCDEHIKHILQMSTPTQLLATKKQTMTRIDQLIGPKEQGYERPKSVPMSMSCETSKVDYATSEAGYEMFVKDRKMPKSVPMSMSCETSEVDYATSEPGYEMFVKDRKMPKSVPMSMSCETSEVDYATSEPGYEMFVKDRKMPKSVPMSMSCETSEVDYATSEPGYEMFVKDRKMPKSVPMSMSCETSEVDYATSEPGYEMFVKDRKMPKSVPMSMSCETSEVDYATSEPGYEMFVKDRKMPKSVPMSMSCETSEVDYATSEPGYEMFVKDRKMPKSDMPQPKQTLSLTQIEDQAVDGLKNEIFSIIPFKYPESAYKQCEFVSNFPEDGRTSSTLKGTFSLLFQGQPMLVNKDDITCSFRNDDYGINIPCTVDYIIEGDQAKYQVSYKTGHQGGYYSFILTVCQVNIDTRGVVVIKHVMENRKPYYSEPPIAKNKLRSKNDFW